MPYGEDSTVLVGLKVICLLWAFASLARISWGVYLMGMHLMGMHLTGGTAQKVGTNEL